MIPVCHELFDVSLRCVRYVFMCSTLKDKAEVCLARVLGVCKECQCSILV